MATQNYTLGRGKVHFSRFLTGTNTPEGFRYIGNTPEFNLTIESEELDHYSSDDGIREKDDSVPLEVNRTGSMITDSIQPDNVALFFFGTHSTVTTAGSTANTSAITGIIAGRSYKIGSTANNPAGVFGIDPSTFTAEVSGGAALVVDVDYTLDGDLGTITFVEGSLLAVDGADIDITNYDLLANTRARVISGSEPVEGAMMYVANNPKGADYNYYMPYIKVTPNGDYALKGDEWQQIPFSLEVLKLEGVEAIYMDGDPAYT